MKIREKLNKSKYFLKSGSIAIQKIIEKLEVQFYEEDIVKINTPRRAERLWIILEGSIVIDGEELKDDILGDHSIFDEDEELLNENDKEIKLNGFIATISYHNLSKVLSSLHTFQERKSVLGNEKKDPFKLEDFYYIKHFGDGLFGPNFLIKNEETNKLFVLKCVCKALVCEKNLEKHIIVRK